MGIEESGEIALVRTDRPPANAFDLELVEDTSAAVEQLAAARPAAAVITGRDGYFPAGLNLKAVVELDTEGQRDLLLGRGSNGCSG